MGWRRKETNTGCGEGLPVLFGLELQVKEQWTLQQAKEHSILFRQQFPASFPPQSKGHGKSPSQSVLQQNHVWLQGKQAETQSSFPA